MFVIDNDGQVEGDGRVDALTDVIMIVGYMFGFKGKALIANNVASSCDTRKIAAEFELYLASRSGK
jgi:hypothetical protein